MIENLSLPDEVQAILTAAPSLSVANTIADLEALVCGSEKNCTWQVSYTLPKGRTVVEADVVRVKNGVSANYTEPYMRRRDPDCMFVADDHPSDKPYFDDHFGFPFSKMRSETFAWLSSQLLASFAFEIGQPGAGSRQAGKSNHRMLSAGRKR